MTMPFSMPLFPALGAALMVPLAFSWMPQEPAGVVETEAEAVSPLAEHLLLLSTFDDTVDAQLAAGDGRLYTLDRGQEGAEPRVGLHDKEVELAPGKGRFGGALRFKAKKRQLVYYQAKDNMGYDPKSWSGAISFWLQLDPAKDLEPGFCDPIQITDTTYNDASIWVDFTKTNPRTFRLGVIGDLKAWNPENLPAAENPAFDQRLIGVEPQPFSRERWTHVVINFSGLNSDEGKTELYVDGKLMGGLGVKDPFTWEVDRSRIMLGLSYVGLMDELAVLDRPLTGGEVIGVFRGGSLGGE